MISWKTIVKQMFKDLFCCFTFFSNNFIIIIISFSINCLIFHLFLYFLGNLLFFNYFYRKFFDQTFDTLIGEKLKVRVKDKLDFYELYVWLSLSDKLSKSCKSLCERWDGIYCYTQSIDRYSAVRIGRDSSPNDKLKRRCRLHGLHLYYE